MWIDCKSNKWIEAIEEHYKANYMGKWCVRSSNGNFSDFPVLVFYQDELKQHDHSHYFGIFIDLDGHTKICDAQTFKSVPILCILDKNTGEVIASRYRHDFRIDSSGNSIDGGRDYVGVSGDIIPETYELSVYKDKFFLNGEEVEKRYT